MDRLSSEFHSLVGSPNRVESAEGYAMVTRIALVGCGYVADFYMKCLKGYAGVSVEGAYDRDPSRLEAFCRYHGVRACASLPALLDLPDVLLVLNLTNPRSHMEVSSMILEAGRHVFTEKPLAMTLAEAQSLAALAREKNLRIGCAPCNMLSDMVQTAWKAIRDRAIGDVRAVYVNYDDDGLIAPRAKPWLFKSASGAFWPAKDEFEVGCTYEHAGYFLSCLSAFFGPARQVTSIATCQIADKGIAVDTMAPDFSTGCIEYDGGIVARVTCGLLAPKDHSMLVVGTEGTLVLPDLRNEKRQVRIRPFAKKGRGRYERIKKYPRARGSPLILVHKWHKPVDFFHGPMGMIDAIREGRPHRLSAELGIHIVEIIEALQYPERFSSHKNIESDFPAIEPLPWIIDSDSKTNGNSWVRRLLPW